MQPTQPHESLSRLSPGTSLFFVGIGGISMAGLAEISLSRGFRVAGSDRHPSARTEHLAASGVRFFEGHSADSIDATSPEVVIHTAAVHDDNPELQRAREKGIRVVDRASFLGWLTEDFPSVINISGTHGKTTTTALCSLMLIEAGLDPTVHLGGELEGFHGSVRIGADASVGLLVSEACEYTGSFLKSKSTTAAVLNIDYDHVDCFRDIDHTIDTFVAFADGLPEEGHLVVPCFDPNVQTLLARLAEKRAGEGRRMPELVTFGFEADCVGFTPSSPTLAGDASIPGGLISFSCSALTYPGGYPDFDILRDGAFFAHASLRVPGDHNILNALAAAACAERNGCPGPVVASVLAQYRGAEGRFTIKGTYRGATVVADYAHHPAAARATLRAAARIPHGRTWVVFQPLTYSRTRVLFDDFVSALTPCADVIFAEIFSDREVNRHDISSRDLMVAVNAAGGHAEFGEDFFDITRRLDERVHAGDLILVLGPEDIRSLADRLVRSESGALAESSPG
jgi:UDP-N-acetylmuramate--alanine ligase